MKMKLPRAKILRRILLISLFLLALVVLIFKGYLQEQYFIIRLKVSKPPGRIKAVSGLAYHKTLRSVRTLIHTAINDDNPEVRTEASIAFDEAFRLMSNEELTQLLLESIKFDDYLTVECLLGRIHYFGRHGCLKPDRVISKLIKVFKEADKNLASIVASVLVESNSKQAIQFFRTICQYPDPIRQGLALEALGSAGDESSIGVMLQGMENEDSFIRSSSIIALHFLVTNKPELASKSILKKLLKALKDPARDVRLFTLVALANPIWESPEVEQEVITILLNERDIELRRLAIYALGEFRSSNSVPYLIDLVNDKTLRFSAISSLTKLGDQRLLLLFITLWDDPDKSVSVHAINAVERLSKGSSFRFQLDRDHFDIDKETKRVKKWWLINRSKYPKQILPKGMNEEDIIKQFEEDTKD